MGYKELPGLLGTSTRPGALLLQKDNVGPHRYKNVIPWFP